MADFGYAFTPGLANRFKAATNSNNSQLPVNATQALQILSLHLPDVIGGASVAPDALLRGTPGPDPMSSVGSMTGGTPSPASSPSPAPPQTPASSPFGQTGPDTGPAPAPASAGVPRITVPSAPVPGRVPDLGGLSSMQGPGIPNLQSLMTSIFGPGGFPMGGGVSR